MSFTAPEATAVHGGTPGQPAGTDRVETAPLSGRRRRWGRTLEAALVVGVWLLAAVVFFREQLTSGFKSLMGNDGDMRLAAYLCEHWFRVLHGQESWLNPSFFYPVKGLLGWSDTFFIFQVFYAPLRLLGCDPFLALQITMILLTLVGYVAVVYLLRLALNAPLPIALLCGLLFCFSNALWLHSASAQFFGIYLVPVILLLAHLAWRSSQVGRRVKSTILAAAAGLLWGLLLFSTYYIAWFSTLAAIIVVVLYLLTGGRSSLKAVINGVRSSRRIVLAGIAGLAVGLIPFARTYLPNRHSVPYSVVMALTGHWPDLGNLGVGNVIWGGLDKSALGTRVTLYEVSYAVTPVLLALTVVSGVWCLWLLWSKRYANRVRARLAFVLALATVILYVLPVNSHFGSPWVVVYHLPGADAMRAIDRIQLAAGGLAALALAAAATEAYAALGQGSRAGLRHGARRTAQPGRSRGWAVVGLALLVLVTVEQLNTARISYISRPQQLHFLSSIVKPPAGCRTFFVTDSVQNLAYYEYQIDAMFVAQRLSMPTINGYTGNFPPGWGLLDPTKPTYSAAVAAWSAAHGLQGRLCRLDLGTMRWAGPAL